MVVIEDKAAESAAKAMQEFDAKVVTVTLGSQVSGELAHFEAVDMGEGEIEEDEADENKVEDKASNEPAAA
jgi:hypothetical protein